MKPSVDLKYGRFGENITHSIENDAIGLLCQMTLDEDDRNFLEGNIPVTERQYSGFS